MAEFSKTITINQMIKREEHARYLEECVYLLMQHMKQCNQENSVSTNYLTLTMEDSIRVTDAKDLKLEWTAT